MASFIVPQGTFTLHRFPRQSHPSLRAWDAADELLLRYLDDTPDALTGNSQPWIYNDSFGALTTALHSFKPISITDSWLAHQATESNYADNQLTLPSAAILSSLAPLPPTPELVLIKIPKTRALLEDQLCRLSQRVGANTRIIGAAMAKHIHRSTLELFERLIGTTRTSLATKKARLIFVTPDSNKSPTNSPYPSHYPLENSHWQLDNHANVFSRERLDIGTRLFLQHIPEHPGARTIIDLGCGNGVVGLVAAERNPEAQIHFIDESYMALDSARRNFEAAFVGQNRARYLPGNCLDGVEAQSADLILNNPPFHQQQAVGDHIAKQMFRQSLQTLRPAGALWVIGNRHLGYHKALRQLFGNCELVASNAKFVVLKAIRQR